MKPQLNHTDLGFTLAEFIASSAIGMLVIGLALSATVSSKQLLKTDLERTKIMQNLRSSSELIGIDIRITGESLPSNFSAVELIDGTGTNPDQLILRRSLLSEVLTLCDNITAGSSTSQVMFAVGDGTVDPGVQSSSCVYSDPGQRQNYLSWRAYRTSGGTTLKPAYIYDTSSKKGEFFTYTSETDSGSQFTLSTAPHVWTNAYQYISSSVYILEEHRYRLLDNNIQLIENQNWGTLQNIVTDIADFQLQVRFSDGSVANEYLDNAPLTWSMIRRLDLTVRARERVLKNWMDKSYTAQFFPRNILSN